MSDCLYCGQPVDGSVCRSCGAFQLKRRHTDIKLPAPVYAILLEWIMSTRRFNVTRVENAGALQMEYKGKTYRFSVDGEG